MPKKLGSPILKSLDKVEVFEVTRSYSQTVQVKQYEPINVFCSARAQLKEGFTEDDIVDVAQELNDFVKERVADEVEKYTNPQRFLRKVNAGAVTFPKRNYGNQAASSGDVPF